MHRPGFLGRVMGVCRDLARTQSNLGRDLANIFAWAGTHDRNGRTRRIAAGGFRFRNLGACRDA